MKKFGVVMMLLVVSLSQAATYRFVGTEDNLWSNVNNWTKDGVAATVLPSTADDVRINASCVLDYNAGIIHNLQVGSGGAGDLTVEGGYVTATDGLCAVGFDSLGTLTINSGEVILDSDSTIGCWGNKGTVIVNGGRLWVPALLVTAIYDNAGVFIDSEIIINGGAVECYYFERKGGVINITNGQFRPWYSDGNVVPYITNGYIIGFGGQGTVTFDTVVLPHTATATHNMQPAPAIGSVTQIGDVELSWNNIIEPNDPGDLILVDVWFGTEPNKLSSNYVKVLSDLDVTGVQRSSMTVNAPAVGTYYWQVDTENGDGDPNKIESTVFTFSTTNDVAPTVNAGVNMITWINEPVQLAPTVLDDGVSPVTYSWTAAPATGVTFSPDAAALAPTVTVDNAAGAVTLTLTVKDEFNPAVSDTMTVSVYGSACSAAYDGAGLRNIGDLYFDCKVDLQDFAALAAEWLADYTLLNPVPAP